MIPDFFLFESTRSSAQRGKLNQVLARYWLADTIGDVVHVSLSPQSKVQFEYILFHAAFYILQQESQILKLKIGHIPSICATVNFNSSLFTVIAPCIYITQMITLKFEIILYLIYFTFLHSQNLIVSRNENLTSNSIIKKS